MILAEASNEFMGAWVYVLIALVGGAAAAVSIYAVFRKQKVEIEPNPIMTQRQAKRFNHDLAEQRHTDVTRRLGSHDAEIDALWNSVRVDIPAMERRLNDAGEDRTGKIHDRINDILSAVMELKGKVK